MQCKWSSGTAATVCDAAKCDPKYAQNPSTAACISKYLLAWLLIVYGGCWDDNKVLYCQPQKTLSGCWQLYLLNIPCKSKMSFFSQRPLLSNSNHLVIQVLTKNTTISLQAAQLIVMYACMILLPQELSSAWQEPVQLVHVNTPPITMWLVVVVWNFVTTVTCLLDLPTRCALTSSASPSMDAVLLVHARVSSHSFTTVLEKMDYTKNFYLYLHVGLLLPRLTGSQNWGHSNILLVYHYSPPMCILVYAVTCHNPIKLHLLTVYIYICPGHPKRYPEGGEQIYLLV